MPVAATQETPAPKLSPEVRTGAPEAPVSSGTTVRRRLLLVILSVVVPLVLLASVLLMLAATAAREQAEARLRFSAASLATLLDARFAAASQVLSTIATDPKLAERDLPAFEARARMIASRLEEPVIVYRADGTILSISTPANSPVSGGIGQRSSVAEAIATAARTGNLVITDFVSAGVAVPGIAVLMPTEPTGGERLVLGIVITGADFHELLTSHHLPPTWYAAIVDRRMQQVARTRLNDQFVGRPPAPELVQQMQTAPAGIVTDFVSTDGQRVVAAFARAEQSGYGIIVGKPIDEYRANAQHRIWQMLGIGLGLAGAGILLALATSRRLVGAILALKGLATGRGRLDFKPTGVQEVDEAAVAMVGARRAEQRAMRALADSEHRARRSSAEIEALYANAPVGIALFDRDLRFKRVNAALTQINEIPMEQHLGAKLFELIPQLEPALGDIMRRIFEEGASFPHIELDSPVASGRAFVLRYFPVEREEGQVLSAGAIVEEVSDQRRAERALREERERLQTALAERELLLREVDHRVKNSLSVVQSLLRLQMRTSADEQVQADLRDAAQRINSIATLHDRLHRSTSISTVEAGAFLGDVADGLSDAYGLDKLERPIEVTAEPIELTSQQAVSLGLAATELLTNAVKYGRGRISLKLKRLETGEVEFLVCDEGDGPPTDDAGADHSATLGMQIVHAMARQLGGRFEVIRRETTVCCIIKFSQNGPRAPG